MATEKEMSSSQREGSNSEMVHEQRPLMSTDLFLAAIKGDEDVLIQRLGMSKERNDQFMVTIEASHSAPKQINTENQTIQSKLQSATRFGDTVLHVLVTEGHNELALKVFERDMSLLKAQNKMFETPLYSAAKVGNEKVIHNLIQIDHVMVKDALKETDENGGTALHVAAKNNQEDVGRELMMLDPEVAYKVNKKWLSPLYIAIVEGHTMMVQTMLEVDPTLAFTKFSDGMFPVHVAARMGNKELVMHFMEKYSDGAQLRDPRGRNLFHIAAEENQYQLFWDVFKDTNFEEMKKRMNTATNYEGNTPFHIEAMKGHKSIMRAIWEKYKVVETVPNKKGLTPFQLSARQVVETNKDIDDDDISDYVKNVGKICTRKWFEDVMELPLENRWERTQVIRLGSVLITTVTFAAAFTIPGGYNQDHGTPILGRRYMFRAFIIANALAFIQGFISLIALLSRAMRGPLLNVLNFATASFLFAANSMVVAFGLGMYVTLAPVCYPIAIVMLVTTLFIGSPAAAVIFIAQEEFFKSIVGTIYPIVVALYAAPFLLIFCLALL